jgi:hypothetical protein
MTKIGKNAACPCGSGRKYKACCLGTANSSDFQFRLNRRLSSELIPRVIEFADESTEVVSEAWMQFYGTEDIRDMETDSEMNALFMPWFLFNWGLELEEKGTSEIDEITIAELFLVANAGQLTIDEKDFLVSSVRCPYTFCEVRDVKPGVGFTRSTFCVGSSMKLSSEPHRKQSRMGKLSIVQRRNFAGFDRTSGQVRTH